MRLGAALGNMGQAWWVPTVHLPGDEFRGKPRSRSVRLERSRPRSIIVNRYGKRFCNEAADYNSLGGPFHDFDANRMEFPNMPAWMVIDQGHLDAYDFLGLRPGEAAPEWFATGATIEELAAATGVDPAGLAATIAAFNENADAEVDPDFARGQSAYDGYWGDPSKPTRASKTLGRIDTGPFYAVPVNLGCMGTKGGPRTDRDGRVLDVDGEPIAGLYAAGNAMAGPTGMAYGGAGGTIGPAMVFGHRSARHAVEARVAAAPSSGD
jgi:3-oxosteroid 1-dehydrogenase